MRLTRLLQALCVCALPLVTGGCVKKMLVDGQIEGTREASDAFDTIGDYELARSAAESGVVQFEGMHRLAPNNEDALFLLVKGWAGFGYGFAEDAWEAAVDAEKDDLATYHQQRAKAAFDRAVFYGLELLGHKHPLTDADKKTEDAAKAWAAKFDSKDDAANLFWTGYAWLARADLMKGDFEQGVPLLAELFVGVAMLEQSRKLDPFYNHWAATVAMAAYHARTAMSQPELAESKRLFDEAVQRTQGKSLIVQYNYAVKYACMTQNKELYAKLLNEVLAAQDPDPEQRLTNAIAKRRARRAFGKREMMACNVYTPGAGPASSGSSDDQ